MKECVNSQKKFANETHFQKMTTIFILTQNVYNKNWSLNIQNSDKVIKPEYFDTSWDFSLKPKRMEPTRLQRLIISWQYRFIEICILLI